MKKAVIVTYFNNHDQKIKRTGVPAGTNVVLYFAQILNKIGYCVEIISPSWFIGSRGSRLFVEDDERLNESCLLLKAPSIPRSGGIIDLLKKNDIPTLDYGTIVF